MILVGKWMKLVNQTGLLNQNRRFARKRKHQSHLRRNKSMRWILSHQLSWKIASRISSFNIPQIKCSKKKGRSKDTILLLRKWNLNQEGKHLSKEFILWDRLHLILLLMINGAKTLFLDWYRHLLLIKVFSKPWCTYILI